MLSCRSQADDVVEAITSAGRRATVVAGSLADVGVIEQLAEVATDFGAVRLLVNNAGITNSGQLADLTIEQWREAVDVNLTAPAWLSKCLAGVLRENRGTIVNVASTGGVIGSVHSLPYGSTKAGMIGLTKTLARMLAPDVRVNTICPGPIDTDLLSGIADEQMAAIVGGTPLGRLGGVDEISRAALDISEWSYCTGQTIVVDGGRVMM